MATNAVQAGSVLLELSNIIAPHTNRKAKKPIFKTTP